MAAIDELTKLLCAFGVYYMLFNNCRKLNPARRKSAVFMMRVVADLTEPLIHVRAYFSSLSP